MWAARARMLIATAWVGSLWTTGYLTAPTLFTTLDDKVLAGSLAGAVFRVEAWLSVCCAAALMALLRFATDDGESKAAQRGLWIVAAMLMCTLIGYFSLQPFMAAIREAAGPGGLIDPADRSRFGMLHGAASAIYLVQSLLGAVLILRMR